jgi:hypothetical protein
LSVLAQRFARIASTGEICAELEADVREGFE